MPENKVAKLTGHSSNKETLCFDKNEFMKANFSVDEFLHKNRNAPSLEQLRDNLGLYLKDLRASMIDLINEDYADFVSLSANLVGLDESIDTILCPLDHFRVEIEGIQTLIQDNANDIRMQLQRKQQLRVLKRNLLALKKVYETTKKLEDLLAVQLNETLRPIDMERAALELIQLKFNEKFCEQHLKDEHKQNILKLEEQVLEKLQCLFVDALKTASSNAEHLERCLRIYITLDSTHIAEHVFRKHVVSPFMQPIISEHQLQNSPQGLAGIYSKILNFISLHMPELLRLTLYTDKLLGFNFLIDSFWAEVEWRIETNMSSIFAPGNSEVFYAKYKCTCDFLLKIEELLANELLVIEFRKHKQSKSFQARWNLPVYFQICFQEIAGKYEATLEPVLQDNSLSSKDGIYRLAPFRSAIIAIERCWAEGIYLPEVFPKFFKLNVQIIMRLSRWISDAIQLTNQNTKQKSEFPKQLNKVSLLIALHSDIRSFATNLKNNQQTIHKNIPKVKQCHIVNDAVSKSFVELQEMLQSHICSIQNSLVGILISESGMENIKQVNDLPRLYRKTNREVPTRSSTYVEQMLRPLRLFATQQQTALGKEVVQELLAKVFAKITKDYYVAVSDVLTSVQKTEESLRRLRNLKSNAMSSSQSNASMSDDDKIRLQLRVDVSTWMAELAKLDFMPMHIETLSDLNQIVEDSLKTKE